MSKRKWLIVVAFILVVVAIGLGVGLGVGLTTGKSTDGPIWYQANILDHVGAENPCSTLVKSCEELNNLPCNVGNKYDKAFFRKNAIIIYTYSAMSDCYEFSVKNVYIENGILNVDIISRFVGGLLQSDWGWQIIIEIKKSDIRGITEIKENLITEDD